MLGRPNPELGGNSEVSQNPINSSTVRGSERFNKWYALSAVLPLAAGALGYFLGTNLADSEPGKIVLPTLTAALTGALSWVALVATYNRIYTDTWFGKD